MYSSKKISQQGNIFLYLFFLVLLIIGVWYFIKSYSALQRNSSPKITYSPPPKDETISWNKIEDPDFKMSLNIPPEWYFENKKITLEKLPKNASKTKKYNIITYSKKGGVVMPGLYVEDFYNQINSLKVDEKYTRDVFNSNNEKISKLSSGKIRSGQKYIIFKSEAADKVEPTIESYIVLEGQNVIVFSLTQYTDYGVEYFQKIVPTVSLN